MTTVYKYKKCNLFGFAKTTETVTDKFDNCLVYDNGNEFVMIDEDIMKDTNENGVVYTFVFDLESEQFNDIHIKVDETDSKTKTRDVTNGNYKHDEKELSRLISGNSSQLDAFTSNLYTVIYGKKTANIYQGQNNVHIFNHNVIDSLAKNGIIVDQSSNGKLSVHNIMDELEKLRHFNVFFIHSFLDLDYVVNESPSELSHPIYVKGKGEITAVFYRNLVLRFFPYLTITTESMRENAYLF